MRQFRPDLPAALWFVAALLGCAASAVVVSSGRFGRWPVVMEVLAATALGALTVLAFAPWRTILGGTVDRRVIRRLTERLRRRDREPLSDVPAEAGDRDVAELRRAIAETLAVADADRMEARRLRRTMDDSIRKETGRATGRLQREAATDPLTGVGNRRALQEQIGSMLERARAGGQPLTALMIDVDRFKLVNDALGHAAGDECLARLGRLLGDGLREGDRAYRSGGDEFVVLMPGAGADVGRNVAERLRSLHAQTAWPHDRPPRPTLSIGIATATARDDQEPQTLLRRADAAMYAAKRAGRDRILDAREVNRAA